MNLETRLLAGTNYLRLNPDRALGFLPYFNVCVTGDIPYLRHSGWDLCDVGWRFVEAWHMIRQVTGDSLDAAERAIRKTVFETIRPDGLSYRNQEPWCLPEAWMWDQGRALSALCSLAEGGDEADTALSHADKMLHALQRIAWVDGKALWFPKEGWDGRQWGSPPVGHPPTGLQIDGAVRYYQLTGEEWALDFADKVAQGVMTRNPPLFSAEGGFHLKGGGPQIPNTHLHSRLFIVTGLLRLADVAHNAEYRSAAESAFQSVLNISTSYGWVPERQEQLSLGAAGLDEVCCIMDMIQIALIRASREPAPWYDLVERYVANQVCAHQLIDDSRIKPYMNPKDCPPEDTRKECFHNVWQRSQGGFAGGLHAHEFWRQTVGESFPDDPVAHDGSMTGIDPSVLPHVDASGCCGPSGIICMALALQHSLEETRDGLRVNMHFPRRGKWADVETASPEAGQARIRLKHPTARLGVRLPPWMTGDQIRVTMNEAPVPFSIRDQYVWIESAAGTVTVHYPSVSRQTREPVRRSQLTAWWKGNLVERIESTPSSRVSLYPVLSPDSNPGSYAEEPTTRRWSKSRIEKWYGLQPWMVGCNFIPSSAVNQLEMWQEDTFDPKTIDVELGWASRLGFNTVRVYLHDLVYEADPSSFKKRMDLYLAMADKLNIRSILVFFDDCWNPSPRLGRQPDPEPHLHNSHWMESPGIEELECFPHDMKLRQRLETYVKDILTTYAEDTRVLLWDLYNEPGNFMKEPGRSERVGDRCLPLLKAVFGWARDVSPSQPVTSGLYKGDYQKGNVGEISRVQHQNSDLVTFHNYGSPDSMENDIRILKDLTGRPLICTEYMARPTNRFETILPILKEHRVGAINWGLVAGKTQTLYPWESWNRAFEGEPDMWFHDILRPDGTAYDNREVEFIKDIAGKTR